MKNKCLICHSKVVDKFEPVADGIEQNCAYCGHFKISNSAAATEWEGDGVIAKLRGYIASHETENHPAELNTYNIQAIIDSQLPSVSDRANLLLSKVHADTTYLGQRVNILSGSYLRSTYSVVDSDLNFLVEYLESEALVKNFPSAGAISVALTPKGFAVIEQQKGFNNTEGKSAFVAMWFDKQVQDAYELGIKEAIKASGYSAIRIDEVHHHHRIEDQILRAIREAHFVVADLTGNRGGVYFEAGFAMALNKPVIWCCHEDHFKDVHFDVNHYHIIVWSSIHELKERLTNKLLALFGHQRASTFASTPR